MKHIAILLAAFIYFLNPTDAHAQWSIGAKGGVAVTSIDRSQMGRVDETYSSQASWSAGIIAGYGITDWLAIRAEMDIMDRAHRMDRNLPFIDPVYTIHHNCWISLPVLADFSFGGKRLRGHMYGGMYAGYLLNARRQGVTFWMTDYYLAFNEFDEKETLGSEYKRLAAGLELGAGISYEVCQKCSILLDALYMYDLTSHHASTPYISDPRYLNTLGLSLGVSYRF